MSSKILKRTLLAALIAQFSAGYVLAENANFNIHNQRLDRALTEFAEQADIQLIFSKQEAFPYQVSGLSGELDIDVALRKLLSGTGMEYSYSSENTVVIKKTDRSGSEKAMDKKSRELEEMIVTAQKREQSVIDVPISISALSGETLDERGITDLQSLSMAVPGLLVAESGSFQRRISIRGIGNVFGDSSLVGLYMDQASVSTLPANQLDLRIYDLERVEVLKGPQGTLYGEGSVGGTIRYITKDPQLDSVSGNIGFDNSVTKNGASSQEIRGVFNAPLADNLGLRIVGQYDNSGGWIDQPAFSRKDINDYELYNIRAKLLWLPTDKLEVKATAIVHRNDTGAESTGEDENGNYRQVFDDPEPMFGLDNYNMYNLLVNYDLDAIRLVSSTTYLDSEKMRNNYGFQCCGLATNPTSPNELFSAIFYFDSRTTEILTQELRVEFDNGGNWHWTTGLYFKDAELTNNSEILFGDPGVFDFIISTDVGRKIKSRAIFGEAGYSISDNLEAGFGLRYFEEDREVPPGGTAAAQGKTFDSLNPKFYLSYHPAEDVNLYINISKGFRSGGFNVFQPPGTPGYEPEEVLSYELGTKMSALGGRLNTDLALFYSDYQDYQTNGLVGGVNLTSNAGDARIQGMDFSITSFPTDNLELGATLSYIDSEFTKIDTEGGAYIVGDPVDLVPEYGFNMWGQYAFNWFDNSPGFVRVDYSQQGLSNYRARNLDVPAAGLIYHSTSNIINMLNARVSWKKNSWSLQLYGNNLLDENGFINPFSIEGIDGNGSPRPRPRTVGVNVGYQF